MGTGQQLITIAALALVTLLILNVHQSTNQRLVEMYSNEAVIAGTGFAESMIDEIETKAFDQKTVSKVVTSVGGLTPANLLGPDPGEKTSSQFNDVDDYNNYVTTDSLSRMGKFTIRVTVHYVVNFDPSVISNYPTFAKRINVFVTNNNFLDTLKISTVVAY